MYFQTALALGTNLGKMHRLVYTEQEQVLYFDVQMDFLTFCVWIHKIEQYLTLFLFTSLVVQLLVANKIVISSTLPPVTAAFRWYFLVQSNEVPTSFVEFNGVVQNEIVP